MSPENIIGIIAGVLSAASMLPQLIKLIKEKESEDLSAWMLVILLLGLAGWIVYGILKKDYPIIITNSFSFTINCIVIILKYTYKK